MNIYKINDMKLGWFVGSFTPTAYSTNEFEVAYKVHCKGEPYASHYHKMAVEINYLIRGKMKINDVEISAGEIFVIYPNEIAAPFFLEDCELIVVKAPSVLGDKYEV
jgi:mannose-6-phosphate isomerase-like protein (cupin superfamily)